jgi:hypothetical protein
MREACPDIKHEKPRTIAWLICSIEPAVTLSLSLHYERISMAARDDRKQLTWM